ncbi:DUF547 domain-containing protein [bacterium AH-315-P07]|nr:DUF547 domain-containing protein [bacterium AH-315-P07]
MGSLSPDTYAGWSKDHQLAFWINAYNAITLRAIIDNYPIKKGGIINRNVYPANSIRQIAGVWKKNTTSVLGKPITLNDIEHDVLRDQFNQPLMHFAIVCASISCPALRNEAFESDSDGRLLEQLSDQAAKFLADPAKFRIDEKNKIIYLSPILDWFDEDFVEEFNLNNEITGRNETTGAVLDFIRRNYQDKGYIHLTDSTYKIDYLDYDWSLNVQQ